jgi:hypothetical protein
LNSKERVRAVVKPVIVFLQENDSEGRGGYPSSLLSLSLPFSYIKMDG